MFAVSQQPHSPARLKMLLQYVIFPMAGQEGPLRSELWVEPQHGVVCSAPASLGCLKGLTYRQISDEVGMNTGRGHSTALTLLSI